MVLFRFYYLTLCCLAIPIVNSKSKYEKLLVISFDGFRFDYLNYNVTPTLNSLRNSSTFAKYMLNVFPTQTFPNHFTLATGLYTEVHCLLQSKIYDKKSHSVLHYGYEMFHYNEDIIPIWVLNEMAGGGRHSGVMMWPGSNFPYSGRNVTFVVPYQPVVPLTDRLDIVVDWFLHPTTPANLVMFYMEEPDQTSHAFGPDSGPTKAVIKDLDKRVAYLMDNLKKNNLTDVNIVFLSDHGMEAVTKKQVIDLSTFLNDEADFYGTSPISQVYPKEGVDTKTVFEKLNNASLASTHFKVYLRENIPEELHFKNCDRVPPILAVAEPPFALQDMFSRIEYYTTKYNVSENGTFGIHGYDPRSINMHPYFIAHGPRFKRNYTGPVVRSIDMFPMFLHILGLQPPNIKPNGSLSNVEEILINPNSSGGQHLMVTGLYVLPVVLILYNIGL